MYIELFENFLHDADPVRFPCFEMDITAISPLSTSSMSWQNPQLPQYSGDNINFVFYNPAAPDTNYSALFPDWASMPHLSTAEGCIIRTESKYTVESGSTYYIADSDLIPATIGTKPSDWESDWMYYGTIETKRASDTLNYFKMYTPVFGSGASSAVPAPDSMWNPNVQYYKNNPQNHDFRLSRIFSTYNLGSFGVSALYGGSDPPWVIKSPRACGVAPTSSEYELKYRNFPHWAMHGYNGDYSNFNEHFYLAMPVPWTATNAAGYIFGFDVGSIYTSTAMTEYHNQMFIFVHFVYDNKDFYGIALLNMSDNTANAYPKGIRITAFSENFWGNSISPDSRPENFGTDSTWAGGNGSFDDSDTYNRGDDTGTLISSYATEINTALSSLGCFNPATGNGFNIYSVLSEPSALPALFADMYDGASTWLSRYQFLQYNPMSAFLAFHLMPATLVSLSGTQKALTASGYNFLLQPDNPVPQLEVVNPICALHIGSFDFSHYFDGFADFAPYTKIYLHLPFCGVMQIDVNAVMYGYLSIDYLADAISGNVSAFVTCCDKNGRTQILYNSTGNCAYSLPLFSETQSTAATGKILSGIVSGGIGAMMGGGLSSAAGIAETLLPFAVTGTMPRHTDVSGTFGGNNAMITDTQCYLEIVRPEWVNPETYADLESIPAEIGGTIAELELTGKTVISKIETDNISCTDEEKKEITRILADGIFIRE